MPSEELAFDEDVERKAREMCAAAKQDPDRPVSMDGTGATVPNWRRFRLAAIHSLRRRRSQGDGAD